MEAVKERPKSPGLDRGARAQADDARGPGPGTKRPLAWEVLARARRHPFQLAMVDSSGKRLSYGQLAAGAVHLARLLRRIWDGEEMAGICLPPSVGAAVVNLAASLLGKPVVNLNYTASTESLRSSLEQCGIRNVVTSQAFLEKTGKEIPATLVKIESLVGERNASSKMVDALCAWLLPAPLLRRWIGARAQDPGELATVIFSSGSTGEPKGVMQTHLNILSNIRSVNRLVDLSPKHRLLGVLPFFHSTGYTWGLWAPLLTGMPAVYHPNPLDAQTVGKLVKEHQVTLLFATPTFLQTYARRCQPADFASLKLVVAGAEKLTSRVAEVFKERFGLEPLEGYGCTETSPLVSLNVPERPDLPAGQGGNKPGTVGRQLPGVSLSIVHPETGAALPRRAEGMIVVKGPNVMKGYLKKPELTAEVLQDGWYRTGDMGFIDEEGFLTVTGRLSRFSKIGGEMVPHLKVEEVLHRCLGLTEQALCVTSVADAEKGERLAVVHTLPDEKLDELFTKLPSAGLPNLYLPRRDAFLRVAEIPILGTGKLDLMKVQEMARRAAPEQPGKPEAQ